MEFKIQREYAVNALFESDVAVDGSSYLVIYGKHINGYYCCIPNWNLGCEMGTPDYISYNTEKLVGVGVSEPIAYQIAKSIQHMCEQKTKVETE